MIKKQPVQSIIFDFYFDIDTCDRSGWQIFSIKHFIEETYNLDILGYTVLTPSPMYLPFIEVDFRFSYKGEEIPAKEIAQSIYDKFGDKVDFNRMTANEEDILKPQY